VNTERKINPCVNVIKNKHIHVNIHTISSYNLIADEAKIPEKLMVMGFAIGKTFLLIMAITQERFLTFSAYKMLHINPIY
jgi:hypothetical protein